MAWFRSYLSRTQTVRCNNVMSDVLNIKTGIGQGTILGPLIFIFYINDIIVLVDLKLICMQTTAFCLCPEIIGI